MVFVWIQVRKNEKDPKDPDPQPCQHLPGQIYYYSSPDTFKRSQIFYDCIIHKFPTMFRT